MEWTDDAFVLHVGRFREADLWVRLFTRKQGILTAFAFGGSRSLRRFCGCLDICNCIVCRVKSTKASWLALQEASLLQGPRRLRADMPRLGLAVNCLRFLEALEVRGEGSLKAFALTGEILQLLEEAPSVPPLLAPFFRLRIASDQGFAPDFAACAHCGREAEQETGDAIWQFVVDRGTVLCPSCRSSGRYTLDISPSALFCLLGVQRGAPEAWEGARLTAAEIRQCGRIVDAFIQYHPGIAWADGRFRKV